MRVLGLLILYSLCGPCFACLYGCYYLIVLCCFVCFYEDS